MKFATRTFQLIKGVGPQREKELWAQGLETWDDFEAAATRGVVLGERLDRELRDAITRARQALAEQSLTALATLLPPREHWRLYGHFAQEAAFFDIEADGDDVPTLVGVMDRQGVATFRRGHSLAQFPERLAQSRLWVTFNGSVYDVPALVLPSNKIGGERWGYLRRWLLQELRVVSVLSLGRRTFLPYTEAFGVEHE